MSRYDRPSHQVYMYFFKRGAWEVQFTEVDLKTPLPRKLTFADPEKIRARSHDLVRTGQEFLEASWMAAAGGGKAPIDLGASAYWEIGDVAALQTHLLRDRKCEFAITRMLAAAPEPDMDAEPIGQGQHQRRGARAGADHRIGDPEAGPLVD